MGIQVRSVAASSRRTFFLDSLGILALATASSHAGQSAARGLQGPLSTSNGIVYGWFDDHVDHWGEMPVEILETVLRAHPNLILVLEYAVSYRPEDLGSNAQQSFWRLLKQFSAERLPRYPLLDRQSQKLVREQSVPLFFADPALPESLSSQSVGVTFDALNDAKKSALIRGGAVVSRGKTELLGAGMLGMSALVTAQATRVERRRALLWMLGLSGSLGLYMANKNEPMWRQEFRATAQWTMDIHLRNAIMAAKLSQLAATLRVKTQAEPAFLVLMGSAHENIMGLLQKDASENQAHLNALLSQESYALGQLWDTGFLLDPLNYLGLGQEYIETLP